MLLSLRNWVLNNWGLKLTAILLAFLLWMSISSQQFENRLIPSVNLEFRNKPENLEIVGPIATRFEVELLTPVRKNILDTDLSIVIDLTGAREGNRVFPVGESSVRAPEGVQVLRVNPSRFALTLEQTTRKQVAIRPRLENQVPAGYELKGTTVEPENVTVSGPASRIQAVKSVTTEGIDLSSRTSTFKSYVNVIDESAAVRIEQVEPVEVTVEIKELRKSVLVRDIDVEMPAAPEGTRFRPARVTATVTVPASFQGDLTGEQFVALVKAGASSGGRSLMAPDIQLREGIQLDVEIVAVSPARVQVQLPPR